MFGVSGTTFPARMQPMKVTVILFFFCTTSTLADYWEDRANLINSDRSFAVGSSLVLSTKEQAANDVLMEYKLKEYDYGFTHPGEFLPAQHFFKSKANIERSEVFKIIKKLPKGSSLHCHDTAIGSHEYLYNLTFEDNLYGCWKDGIYVLHFFNKTSIGKNCDWQLLKTLRSSNASFDKFLKSKLTLVVDDPDLVYPDLNSVWDAFMNIFDTVAYLYGYKPVFQKYLYQVLKELYEDNVMYLEFRGILPDMYDLQGNTYKGVEVVGIYQDVVEKFKKDHPDFHGARFIYAPNRKVNSTTVDEYVELCLKLLELYPDFVAGFDLVGQEDLGNPLLDFISQLMELKNKGTKFFFHAGETNWNYKATDLNLFDAVLLNTTRIGHGYAILKHPALYDIVKERKIALEISPISNQVLKLVEDLRNHPAAVLIANNFPIVITADDPSFWGSNGLSYDWYLAFMAMASRNDDLGFLKQLAMNSIEFSAMKETEKKTALSKWKKDWDQFIDDILVNIPSVVTVR